MLVLDVLVSGNPFSSSLSLSILVWLVVGLVRGTCHLMGLRLSLQIYRIDRAPRRPAVGRGLLFGHQKGILISKTKQIFASLVYIRVDGFLLLSPGGCSV